MSELWLVRHGATPWSLEGRHAGRRDLPLSAEGRAEAAALEPILGGRGFARALVSPQQRARDTCALAGCADRPPTVRDELVEWDWGEYEGVTDEEIERRQPGFSLFRDGAPGGESPRDVEARLAPLLTLLDDAEGATAIFSHGRTLRSLAVLFLGLPHVQGELLSLDTAGVSIVSKKDGQARIKLWNLTPEALPA